MDRYRSIYLLQPGQIGLKFDSASSKAFLYFNGNHIAVINTRPGSKNGELEMAESFPPPRTLLNPANTIVFSDQPTWADVLNI